MALDTFLNQCEHFSTFETFTLHAGIAGNRVLFFAPVCVVEMTQKTHGWISTKLGGDITWDAISRRLTFGADWTWGTTHAYSTLVQNRVCKSFKMF